MFQVYIFPGLWNFSEVEALGPSFPRPGLRNGWGLQSFTSCVRCWKVTVNSRSLPLGKKSFFRILEPLIHLVLAPYHFITLWALIYKARRCQLFKKNSLSLTFHCLLYSLCDRGRAGLGYFERRFIVTLKVVLYSWETGVCHPMYVILCVRHRFRHHESSAHQFKKPCDSWKLVTPKPTFSKCGPQRLNKNT